MKILILTLLISFVFISSCNSPCTCTDTNNTSTTVTAKSDISGTWDIHYSGSSSYDKVTTISVSGNKITFDGEIYTADFSDKNVYFGKSITGTEYNYDITIKDKNNFYGSLSLEITGGGSSFLSLKGVRR